MSDTEETISSVVLPPKSEKKLPPAKGPADLDKETIAADWVESTRELLFTKKDFLKALSEANVCNSGARFKPSDGIPSKRCSTYKGEKPGHQSW